MTLTNDDLLAISQLLDVKLHTELQPIRDGIKSIKDEQIKMKEDISSLKEDMVFVKAEIASLKEDVDSLKKDMVSVKAEIASLKEDMVSVKAEIASLNEDVDSLKKDMVSVKAEVASLKEDMVSVKADIVSLKKEQSRINLIIENDIQRSINILSENYVPAAQRYLKATEQIESMQTDIDILKAVVRDHTEQLKRIS